MHPPWITLKLFLFLLIGHSWILGQSTNVAEENEKSKSNLTVTREQREIIERERRLIPYMTYYLNQGVTSPNSARQNVLIPVSTPRQNGARLTVVPQILSNVVPQRFDVRPKVIAVTPTHVVISPVPQSSRINCLKLQERIQNSQRNEEIQVVGKIYKLQQGVNPYSRQQETRTHQEINVSPTPIQPKYLVPQAIKYVPIIVKSIPETENSKVFASSNPRYDFAPTKFPALVPAPFVANNQNQYDASIAPKFQSIYQRNKVYTLNVPTQNHQIAGVQSDEDKYSVAKLVVESTPAPLYTTGIKVDISDPSGVKFAPTAKPSRPIDLPKPLTVTTAGSTTETQFVAAQIPQYLNQGQRMVPEQNKQIFEPETDEFSTTTYTERLPKLRVPQEEDIKFVASVTPVSETNDLGIAGQSIKYSPELQNGGKNNAQSTLDNFLAVLRETENLPQNLTPENIDTGIKALALILERLQQQKYNQEVSKGSVQAVQPHVSRQDYKKQTKVHSFPQPSGTSTPGRPGIDYPTYSSIPRTNFDCSTQRYKGFFGDPDTKCQVWHYCDLNGGQASFLCPNGTIFSQVALTCDWWFNVKCATTSQLYVLNERLYKYILPFSPSFPEDYSGPIVDTYLAAKFKEMEAKSKSKALKQTEASKKTEIETKDSTKVSTELPREESVTNNSEI